MKRKVENKTEGNKICESRVENADKQRMIRFFCLSFKRSSSMGKSFRCLGTSQSRDAGFHLAGNDGRFARMWFLRQGGFQTLFQITPLQIVNRSDSDLQYFGDSFGMFPAM